MFNCCLLSVSLTDGVVVTVNALTPGMSSHAESFGGIVAVAGIPCVSCGSRTICILMQSSQGCGRVGSDASIGASRRR